jgi:hypothetical protein
MQTIQEAASAFLANKRVAVTGVSRHPENHGSNARVAPRAGQSTQLASASGAGREADQDDARGPRTRVATWHRAISVLLALVNTLAGV